MGAGLVDSKTVTSYNNTSAGVAELADATDLKSVGAILVGSSPTPGTKEGFTLWLIHQA